MKSTEFKTRTVFTKRSNPSFNENAWVIALDVGYSAIKGMSQNMVYSFPYYARKLTGATLVGESKDDEILYRDTVTKEVWAVGAGAQAMISLEDSNDSITSMYGRNRYFSEMFKVASNVGIGLGLIDNEFAEIGQKEVYIQTGLPPIYLASDAPLLKEALSGARSFDIKIGKNSWTRIEYSLDEEHIKVMSQPMGTLFSIATSNDGTFIPSAKEYFSSNLLIFDPGFGTSDYFPIKNNIAGESQTFNDLGMKQVLSKASKEIFRRYGVEISVPAFQNCLKTGTITQFDRRQMKSTQVDISDIIEECSKEVCMLNIEKMKELYNYMQELNYLVITGGCGAAWSNLIREYFKNMENLQIIAGNQNDNLPHIFSNVRGYYMFQAQSLR